MDDWIIGDSPDSGRTYIVRIESPRFIVEMVELGFEDIESSDELLDVTPSLDARIGGRFARKFGRPVILLLSWIS